MVRAKKSPYIHLEEINWQFSIWVYRFVGIYQEIVRGELIFFVFFIIRYTKILKEKKQNKKIWKGNIPYTINFIRIQNTCKNKLSVLYVSAFIKVLRLREKCFGHIWVAWHIWHVWVSYLFPSINVLIRNYVRINFEINELRDNIFPDYYFYIFFSLILALITRKNRNLAHLKLLFPAFKSLDLWMR